MPQNFDTQYEYEQKVAAALKEMRRRAEAYPALLEALRAALLYSQDVATHEELEQLRAAIAQAEGRTA